MYNIVAGVDTKYLSRGHEEHNSIIEIIFLLSVTKLHIPRALDRDRIEVQDERFVITLRGLIGFKIDDADQRMLGFR